MVVMRSLKLISVLMVVWLAAAACRLPGWFARGHNSGAGAATEIQISAAALTPTETFVPTLTLTSTALVSSLEIINRTDFSTSEDPRYEIDLVWPNLAGAELSVAMFNKEIDGWVKVLTENFIMDISTRADEFRPGNAPELFAGQL